MDAFIYTLVRAADWQRAEAAGRYDGSADDRRDGFLHFSTAAQLRATAAKHRAGVADLLLVEVSVAPLGGARPRCAGKRRQAGAGPGCSRTCMGRCRWRRCGGWCRCRWPRMAGMSFHRRSPERFLGHRGLGRGI